MTDHKYIKDLRTPTEEEPLRILTSACLIGTPCGVEGTTYGDYPSVLKLLDYKNVRIIPFCPEDFSFGTPREMCDIHGGDGNDVLDGKAKVLTETGVDWTEGMIAAAERMTKVAEENDAELCVMMDVSAACGSQVIYLGNRKVDNPNHQIGMGVCGALLERRGFKVISQRDFAACEQLYAKIDPDHRVDPKAKDHLQHPWVLDHFNLDS
jgi:uncharacterized protein YbbK (DUF523 family)